MMYDKDFLGLQLHSLATYEYMITYEIFSKKAMGIFSEYVRKMPADKKNPLYFYLAGIRSSAAYIAFNKQPPAIHTDDIRFSEMEKFGAFSLSNVINIQRAHEVLDCFAFTVPSINQKQCEYIFVDICQKLIKMRNKLAHERSTLRFANADIVELLPDSKIESEVGKMYGDLSIVHMSDETKAIFSNLIIMQRIIEQLEKQEEVLTNENVD